MSKSDIIQFLIQIGDNHDIESNVITRQVNEILAILSNNDEIKLIRANKSAHANVFVCLGNVLSKLNIEEKNFSLFWSLYKKYENDDIFKKYPSKINVFLNGLFNSFFIKSSKNWAEAIEIYQKIDSLYDKEAFSSSKAYLTYISYQTKNYSLISSFLNNFYIPLNCKNYNEFTMFNYYRGIILLSQEKFNEASICFLMSLEVEIGNENDCYTYSQIESIKRLSILSGICEDEFSSIIIQKLKNNSLALDYNKLSSYRSIFEKVQKKELNLKDLYESSIKSIEQFKKDKTYVSKLK